MNEFKRGDKVVQADSAFEYYGTGFVEAVYEDLVWARFPDRATSPNPLTYQAHQLKKYEEPFFQPGKTYGRPAGGGGWATFKATAVERDACGPVAFGRYAVEPRGGRGGGPARWRTFQAFSGWVEI